MTPEDRLCDSVMRLSTVTRVPPVVQVQLGAAVGLYKQEAAGPRRVFWRVGFLTGSATWCSLFMFSLAARQLQDAANRALPEMARWSAGFTAAFELLGMFAGVAVAWTYWRESREMLEVKE